MQSIKSIQNGYIGNEKDVENNLGDHGVRKYDYETGRFNSVDPLFEKYYGWSPYQYCMNNPISQYDDNGKWVQEISKESHRNNKPIARNSKGYLAQKINFEFYEKWKTNAPAIAEFVEKNNLFVMQKELETDVYGKGEVGGNLSVYDLNKKDAFKELVGGVLHEIVHNMGYWECEAYGAMIASGYLSKDLMISWIKLDPYTYLHGNNDLIDDFIHKKKTATEITNIITDKGSAIVGKQYEK